MSATYAGDTYAGLVPATDPATVQPPGAPVLVDAVALEAAIRVDWLPPAYNGNADVVAYQITATSTSGTSVSTVWGGAVTSAVVSPLVNGDLYTVTVAAVNSAGVGTPSNTATAQPVATNAGTGDDTGDSGSDTGLVWPAPMIAAFPATYSFSPANWLALPGEAL